MKKIVIIALGRLGQKLYSRFDQSNFSLIGTYHQTRKDVSAQIQYDFNQQEIPLEIQSSDVLIFNLTPSQIKSVEKFELFLQRIQTKKFIFISSTSVYGLQGEVNEDSALDPQTNSGKLLQNCEMALLSNKANATVIRPGGIIFDNSHPAKYLSGRKTQTNGKQSVNLIEIDDLCDVIIESMERNDPVINAVNIHHPNKNDYYNNYCLKNNLDNIEFSQQDSLEDKIVTTKYSHYRIKTDLP